jgi:hypothetical protein
LAKQICFGVALCLATHKVWADEGSMVGGGDSPEVAVPASAEVFEWASGLYHRASFLKLFRSESSRVSRATTFEGISESKEICVEALKLIEGDILSGQLTLTLRKTKVAPSSIRESLSIETDDRCPESKEGDFLKVVELSKTDLQTIQAIYDNARDLSRLARRASTLKKIEVLVFDQRNRQFQITALNQSGSTLHVLFINQSKSVDTLGNVQFKYENFLSQKASK